MSWSLRLRHSASKILWIATILVAVSIGVVGQTNQGRRGADATGQSGTYAPSSYQALQWRNVGPFRGGRATTVTGVPKQRLVYYMGATGGGVWKTEDGGITWRNISDGYMKTGSVGSIAVAPDDPNVIYVGMGEAPVRGMASSFGDGMYKSTDAGKTWKQIGLENTRQISKVVIDPRNNDLVYVAAQGSRWAPTQDRGVYRSNDGGKTWKKVLFVDPSAGPSDMSMDPSNSRIIYAAFWDHHYTPWNIGSGGPNSGIWKTADGGDNWTRLTNGLPKDMGKIGVAVSPANTERVYAIVEDSVDDGGMYRSEDAGKTWHHITNDENIRGRPWYYSVVTADPKNPDELYVMTEQALRSVDGGLTYQPMREPHGDNHALWINPDDPANMINADDGGATITFDGGQDWSSEMNQPTAQFYRVEVDDQFPYRLYAGQQDNTTVSIASRSFGGGIERTDWTVQAGGESATFAFDPKNPRYTYATGALGEIAEFDNQTGTRTNIEEVPEQELGVSSGHMKYRYNWHSPVTTSPFDHKVLYHGANVVFKSTDRGGTWTVISPDLTRNDKSHFGGGGGPYTVEGAGGMVYNTIYYIVESPHEAGTIWVGTDDGLVQLTRDGGKTWNNVTPKGLAEGIVNEIEVSPFDAGTAYVAFTRYKWEDNTPHIFKTTDYGKTWSDLAGGLPQDMPVRVVREDPKRKNLLYAGTENAIWVSFDGGQQWQTLQLNLPRVPVTDLKVHDDDLVASTEGRAFWILDDLTPLHQLNDEVTKSTLYLFKPRKTYRLGGGGGGGAAAEAGVGQNPPNGVLLRYLVGSTPEEGQGLKLEILDATGAVVRTYPTRNESGEAPATGRRGAPGVRPLQARPGMNQFVWDLRTESPLQVPGLLTPHGYRVGAGTYTVRLSLNGKTATQTFELANDPRQIVNPADQLRAVSIAKASWQRVDQIDHVIARLRAVQEQANTIVRNTDGRADAQDVQAAAQKLVDTGHSIERSLMQTYDGVSTQNLLQCQHCGLAIAFEPGMVDQYMFLQDAVQGSERPVTQAETERFGDLERQWNEWQEQIGDFFSRDVPTVNKLANQKGIVTIAVPKEDSGAK